MAVVDLDSGADPAALPVPTGLSPSRMSSFRQCGLAFRYSSIDKLPEEPSPAAAMGTLVHRALELLFVRAPSDRTPEAARDDLAQAVAEMSDSADGLALGLAGGDGAEEFTASVERATELIDRYFALEDPASITPLGLELRLEAEIGGARVRGVIDRLEIDAEGALVVTDYKTGRAPSQMSEQDRMLGVTVYGAMVEQVFGRRPDRIQLLYLSSPLALSTTPSDRQLRGLGIKVGALWSAIERACAIGEFRPKPSRLCDWCSYQELCPAKVGDDEARAALATLRIELASADSVA